MVTHIEKPDSDSDYAAPITHVHMLCGASCVIFDDGEPIPEMDFCMLGRGDEQADCPACRDEKKRLASLRMAKVE